jgi:hypothetical protein
MAMCEWLKKEIWNKEWPIVKSAPCSFAVVLLIGVTIGCSIMFFIYSNFILPDKDAHVDLLQDQIDKLEKEKQPNSIDVTNITPVTKQEIRTFLESINPEILQRIDLGQKKILVCISTQDTVKLSNLSERVDFDKYLSVKQITFEDDSNDLGDPNISIENDEYLWVNNGHYLYPQDALRK